MPVVRPITGPRITTSIAMDSADLGVVRWDEDRQALAVLFGDNFEHTRLRGDWRSPSIAMYSRDYELLGIPTVSSLGKREITPNKRVTQLWPYQHNNPEFTTVLPCDFIRIGEWWYIYVMVTKGLGNERWTGWRRSKDLVQWELVKTNDVAHIHPGQVMLTFDRVGDEVYIFGTGGLARNKPIWGWRCKVSDFPLGKWEVLNHGNPVLQGQYGELCFRYIQGNAVLSFFDAGNYRQSARTIEHPSGDWVQANRVDYAHGNGLPQLYGGYIDPFSQLNKQNGMKFLVSQWVTSTNDPYHVLLVEDTLHAQGPIRESGESESPEEVPDVTQPTPPSIPEGEVEELISLLVKELSASGSVAILDNDGKKRTLRQALEAIHWKEIKTLRLGSDRPRHPQEEDDQYGHILSSRAEGLMTLALLDRLIRTTTSISVDSVYNEVRESFK